MSSRVAIDAQQFQQRRNILLDGQLLEDARLLGQITHVPVSRAAKHRPVGDVAPVKIDATTVGFDHAADHPKAGRLSGTVGAEQSDDFDSADVQIHAVDDSPSSISLLQVDGFEHRSGR